MKLSCEPSHLRQPKVHSREAIRQTIFAARPENTKAVLATSTRSVLLRANCLHSTPSTHSGAMLAHHFSSLARQAVTKLAPSLRPLSLVRLLAQHAPQQSCAADRQRIETTWGVKHRRSATCDCNSSSLRLLLSNYFSCLTFGGLTSVHHGL